MWKDPFKTLILFCIFLRSYPDYTILIELFDTVRHMAVKKDKCHVSQFNVTEHHVNTKNNFLLDRPSRLSYFSVNSYYIYYMTYIRDSDSNILIWQVKRHQCLASSDTKREH